MTGWAQLAFGLDWKRPPRQMIHTAYWYLHTDQFRYDTFGADTVVGQDRQRPARRAEHRRRDRARARGWAGCRRTRRSTATRSTSPTRRPRPGRPVAEHVVDQLKSGDLRFAAEDPDSPENFPRVLAIWRANLLGSSGKGNEYFLKHLLGTDNSLRAGEASESQRPQEVEWHDERARGEARPAAHPRLPPDQHHDLLRRRAARGDLVREARPQHHRHAPVHPLVQPGDRAAVADPHRLGRLADDRRRSSASWPPAGSTPARTSSPSRCCTTPRTRWPTRTASSATGSTASASRSRASRCPRSSRSSATSRPSARRCRRSGRCWRSSAPRPRASRTT